MSLLPDTSPSPSGCDGARPLVGVTIERRTLLQLSLGALALLSLGRPREAQAKPVNSSSGNLTWEALLHEAIPMAEDLVRRSRPDEDSYLAQLGARILRLGAVPIAALTGLNGVASAVSYRTFPVMVMQLRLEPGAAIPYHDHREYNGVLKVISGDVKLRSFEIAGPPQPPDTGASFQIRETRSAVLTPGNISTLSRTRDNIHDIRAGRGGALLLDFFTFFRKDGKSVYLNVEQRSRDARRRIYDAQWR